MWQVILGAAIAGSTGFVAKRFFNPFSQDSIKDQDEEPITPNGVFRFSTSGSTGSGSGPSPNFGKSSRLKSRVSIRRLKKKKKKNGGRCEIENRTSKKARTLSSASDSKHGSCCNNHQEHSSLSSSALGVWMMYMMSAEKSKISKLNAATKETTKVIEELKDELFRIKSLQGGSEKFNYMASRKSGNDGEYASSVLTEEPEQEEAVEMEQLEMELESELQKLNLVETSEAMEECEDLVNGSDSYQCGGVSASELDKKLSRLLIEQQEVQITELEGELQTTQSKLQEKEAELQALKVCVRRLTEFPLLDRSDDEHEQDLKQDLSVSWSQHNRRTDRDEIKSIIGMKRPMESSIHV